MNVNQLELFVLESKNSMDKNGTRVCTKCDVEQPLSEFYSVDSRNKHKHYTCKTCWNKNVSVVNKLRKENFCDVTACECCGKETDKLHLDHDHKTEKFRGWLCIRCNQGIGKLGDNIEGVKKALRYLEKHEVENG